MLLPFASAARRLRIIFCAKEANQFSGTINVPLRFQLPKSRVVSLTT
jgi:hypothetical protein